MSEPIQGVTNAGITGITNTIRPPVWAERAEDKSAGIIDGVKDSSFGSIFRSLIQDVKDTDAEFTNAQYLAATGQMDNPVQLGIAAYKAEMSVELLVQLRDRALSAYNELKNMNL